MEYLAFALIVGLLFAAVAAALSLPATGGGLFLLSSSASMAVGAYAFALFVRTGLAVPLAVLIGAMAAMVVSLPILLFACRVNGDRFAIATLAFQLLVTASARNASHLTGGPMGLTVADADYSALSLIAVALILAVVSIWITRYISQCHNGLQLRFLRDDSYFATSMGIRPITALMRPLLWHAAVTGVAGGVYALAIGFIDPTQLSLVDALLIVSAVLVAGDRHPMIAAGAAVVLVLVPEVLRFVPLGVSAAAHVRQILFGLAILVLADVSNTFGAIANARRA